MEPKSKVASCNYCEGSFTATKDHGKWRLFCSRKCFLASCIRPEPKECKQCGSVFMAKKGHAAASEDGRKIFCSKSCSDLNKRSQKERNCATCGKPFYPTSTGNAGLFCSKACIKIDGPSSPHWKGGISKQGDGQKWVLMPRPGYVGRYMQEHRIVASKEIGRVLLKSEPVIHINNDLGDNRKENLFVCASIGELRRRVSGKLPWPDKHNLDTFK